MDQTIIVKGRLVEPTLVRLAEPLTGVVTDVEVTAHCDQPESIRSESIESLIEKLHGKAGNQCEGSQQDSPRLNTAQLLHRMLKSPSRNRTREDIDAQIREERESWER